MKRPEPPRHDTPIGGLTSPPPVRLAERPDRVGDAARAFTDATSTSAGLEAVAWSRLSERLENERRQGRPLPARLALPASIAVGMLAAAGVLLLVRSSRVETDAVKVATQSSAAKPTAMPAPTPVTPARTAFPPATLTVTPATRPQALAVGVTELPGDAVVALDEGCVARVVTRGGDTVVLLEKGRGSFMVAPRDTDRRFLVETGDVRFVVLGTVFHVERRNSAVSLTVDEGKVATWRGDERLAIAGAGQGWDGDVTPASGAPAPSRTVRANRPRVTTAATESAERCAALAQEGATRAAIDCYVRRAESDDVIAESALYEAARLERAQNRPRAALDLLTDHQRRFPDGALSPEVALSLAELLPAFGRYDEALAHTQSLLNAGPPRTRAAELHLLRGNILREGRNDCGAALAEYRATAASGPGRPADDAAFFAAVCLEKLGKSSEAARAFDEYLLRPSPAHADAARRHRAALTP